MSVLSDPPVREHKTVTPHRLVQQQNRLLRLQAGLAQQIKRLAQDAAEDTPEYSMHMADAATDSFDRDLILGLASHEQEALYEVDAALKRIEDGTYGVCELTGHRIPWKRLKAIPWARFSIEAEAELEAGIHPHIGLLGTVRSAGNEPFATPFDLEAETPAEGSTEHSTSDMVGEEEVS
jgi:RNA polymerase-binding transcription factor DksA